jgi:hypothetical protein
MGLYAFAIIILVLGFIGMLTALAITALYASGQL